VTPSQRRAAILLTAAIGIACALLLVLNKSVLGRFTTDIEEGILTGTVVAQVTLAAAWIAFGPLPIRQRLPLSAGWIVTLGLAFVCNSYLSGADITSLLHVLQGVLVLGLFWLLMQLPFDLLRLVYGWRICHDDEAASPGRLARFGVRQWLAMSIFVALIGIGTRVVVRLDRQEQWELQHGLFNFLVPASVLSCAVLLIVATLLPRWTVLVTMVTLALIAIVTGAIAWLIEICRYTIPTGYPAYIATQATVAVWICCFVAGIRLSGYRLTATRAALPLPAWLRPGRPSFRFSLRTMLVLMGVLGIALGYVTNLWRRVHHQRQVVAKIEAAGGTVRYNWEFAMKNLDSSQEGKHWTYVVGTTTSPRALGERYRTVDGETITEREAYPGPWLIRKLLGDDTFALVETVDFDFKFQPAEKLDPALLKEFPDLRVLNLTYGQVADDWLQSAAEVPKLQSLALWGYDQGTASAEGLSQLNRAKRLRSLSFQGDWLRDDTLRGVASLIQLQSLDIGMAPNVTSAWFANIESLTELQELTFLRTPGIDDRGTASLSQLHNLRKLWLMNTQVTDETLHHLTQLTKLETLNLSGTKVGDVGMDCLVRLKNLKRLELSSTDVGDAGLDSLSGLPLTYLELDKTKITDAGLPALGRMTQLEVLDLSPNEITDEGLPHLATLKNLRRLSLGPNITKEAANKLRAALPECEITRYDANGSGSWLEN
jgi:Leucine-rich repeat (LRR) protein